ncbi:hypothetical protein MY4824_000211 [Beauveria thailandica]
MKPWQNPHRQSNHQKFRFEDLPAELKLIIIKAALPEQRIFHVSGRWTDEYEPKKTGVIRTASHFTIDTRRSHSVTFMVPMHAWATDKLPRLDGLTYVLPKSRDPGGWRRILGRRYTMEWSHTEEQRPRSPRRNWCRCRRTWMCPVTYFEP